MSKFIVYYNIFVASPSDIIEEKELIRDIIDKWNVAHKNLDIQIESVSWDTHARPDMGNSPQTIINKQLVDDCDFIISFFGNRLGTQTQTEESGTVEEINKFSEAGKPVLIYFSNRDIPRGKLDIQQYQELQDYKERCRQKGLQYDYDSIEKLKDLLYSHITSTVLELNKKNTRTNKTYIDSEESRNSQLNILYKRLCLFHQRIIVEFDLEDFRQNIYGFTFTYAVINEPIHSNEEKIFRLFEEIQVGLWEISEWLYDDEFEEIKSKIQSIIITIKGFNRSLKKGSFHPLFVDANFKKLISGRQEILNLIQSVILEFHELISD